MRRYLPAVGFLLYCVGYIGNLMLAMWCGTPLWWLPVVLLLSVFGGTLVMWGLIRLAE